MWAEIAFDGFMKAVGIAAHTEILYLRSGFVNSQNPIFATLAYVGPYSLGGVDTPPLWWTRGLHSLLWANGGLFLAGEQINFLAELVR